MNKRVIITMISICTLSLYGCKGKNETEKDTSEMDLLIEKSFEEYDNRKIYKKLTTEILDSIADDKLEQVIFDNIYQIIGDDYENELENVESLTKGQQAIFSTWILEGEVNNGGFNQFYFNSSGQYAEMAQVGLKTIGADKFSELASKANQIYIENKERLEVFDDGTMENFSESYKDNPLNELDSEFYELYESEKIRDLRIRYIRNNLAEFTSEHRSQ